MCIRDKALYWSMAAASFLCVQLSACRTIGKDELPNRGAVEAKTIESNPIDSYPTATLGEEYDGALPFNDLVLPAYPETLLANRWPPVVLRVRIVVNEGGDVVDVVLLDASEQTALFFSATSAALRKWAFVPLVKIEGGPGSSEINYHGFISNYEGKATALPFHQDYEITFTQVAGKPMVTSSRE